MKKIIYIAVFMLGIAFAQVPERITLQGRLVDENGPINGDKSVIVRIYDNGNPATIDFILFEETQTVTFSDGLYSMQIGESPIIPGNSLENALNSAPRYLGLIIDGTVFPRERLTSVPFAIQSGGVVDGSITSASLANDAVDGDTISDGSISDADISGSASIQASKINDGSGSNLDADQLDGVDSTSFLRSNQSDSFTGTTLDLTTSKLIFGNTSNAISELSNDLLLEGENDIELRPADGVGINTSNPIGPLHVEGVHGDPVLFNTEGASTGSREALRLRATSTNSTGSGFGPSLLFQIDGIDTTPTPAASITGARNSSTSEGYLAFHTNSFGLNERLRLTHEGNLGVGTTEPESRLHVVGTHGSPPVIEVDGANNNAPETALVLKSSTTAGTQQSGFGPSLLFRDHRFPIGEISGINTSSHSLFGNLVFRTNFRNPSTGLFESNEVMRLTYAGHLGLGTESPESRLHVVDPDVSDMPIFERSDRDADVPWNTLRLKAQSDTERGTGFGPAMSFQTEALESGSSVEKTHAFLMSRKGGDDFVVQTPDTNGDMWDKITARASAVHIGGANQLVDDDISTALRVYGNMRVYTTNDPGTLIEFVDAANFFASIGSITRNGFSVSYNAFTGSHYAWTDREIERGCLVRMTGDNRKPEHSEIIYGVEETSKPNDKAALGVFLGSMDADESPDLVAAVGNGDVWVTPEGGDIEPGDLLISASRTGHARKAGVSGPQYVIGRAAERVDWGEVTESDGGKRVLLSVLLDPFVLPAPEPEIAELKRQQAELLDAVAAMRRELDALRKESTSSTVALSMGD